MKDLRDVASIVEQGQFKKLDSSRPEEAKAQSVMTLEATVDVKPQELKSVRPYYESAQCVPTGIPPECQIILHCLLSCFDKQKSVKEGIMKDLIWGFEQGGIPQDCAVLGLKLLSTRGYLKFQAPDNTFIDHSSDKLFEAWVRYQKPLLDLVYG